MNYPKITVVTGNYNHADYLPQSLDSNLSQSYPNFDIIVVDDGSTDNSIEVVNSYIAKDPRVSLIRNETNCGLLHAVKVGTDAATGEFIVYRSADDVSFPGFFEKAARMLVNNPQAGFCCGNLAYSYDDLAIYQVKRSNYSSKPKYFSPNQLSEVLTPDNPMWSHTVMARTEIMRATPFSDVDLFWLWDYLWNTVIAFRHGICYVPEVFAGARFYPESSSFSNSQNPKVLRRILRDILRILRTSCRDVLPYFMKCRILNAFPIDFVETVFENKEFWDMDTLLLLQGPLVEWNIFKSTQEEKKGIQAVIKRTLESNKKWILEQIKASPPGGVVVYGAGSHTLKLLKSWNYMNLPAIDAILVSETPKTSSFCGLPVYPVGKIDPAKIGLVLISSMSFEEAIAKNCRRFLPKVPRLTFWNPDLGTRTKPSLLVCCPNQNGVAGSDSNPDLGNRPQLLEQV